MKIDKICVLGFSYGVFLVQGSDLTLNENQNRENALVRP